MARPKRRSLGALFLVLALGFAGVGFAAGSAGGTAWVIAAAAVVLSAWMAELAFRALR